MTFRRVVYYMRTGEQMDRRTWLKQALGGFLGLLGLQKAQGAVESRPDAAVNAVEPAILAPKGWEMLVKGASGYLYGKTADGQPLVEKAMIFSALTLRVQSTGEGPTIGTLRFDRILGPSSIVNRFREAASDVCKPVTLVIEVSIEPIVPDVKTYASITIDKAILTDIGIGVESSGMTMLGDVGAMFTKAEVPICPPSERYSATITPLREDRSWA